MPLVKRLINNMMPMAQWVDVMVNPVNAVGVAGKGLALAFKEYCPEQYESYRVACIDGSLHLGKLHIYYNTKDKTTIINAITKNHWIDQSNLHDVEITIQAITKYLLQYPHYTVAMPMLGAGLGRLDQDDVYKLFEKYLDPLPNIIFVCMRPDTFTSIPKYLVVGGSREYADYLRIELGIMDGLATFGLSYSDLEAMVSGGARGVDRIVCGSGIVEEDIDPNIAACHKIKSIVAQADWNRYNKSAGFVRNKTLLEIGTHFILFIGSRSVGTRAMKDLIIRHNEQTDKLSLEQWKIYNEGIPDSKESLIEYEAMLPPHQRKKYLYIHDISNISL